MPVVAEPSNFYFAGYVFERSPGFLPGKPRGGTEIDIFGSQNLNAYESSGLIARTFSDEHGHYLISTANAEEIPDYPFYHIVCGRNVPEYVIYDMQTNGGTIQKENGWISYEKPLAGKYGTGNNFVFIKKGAPVANFILNGGYGVPPLAVTGTDTSKGNPSSWEWTAMELPDQTIMHDNQRIFIQTFNWRGSMDPVEYVLINLTVRNAFGEDYITKTVTKLNPRDAGFVPFPPVANFSLSNESGLEPLIVLPVDNSTGFPISWTWTIQTIDRPLNDNVTITDKQPPRFVLEKGIYSFTLTVTNTAGSDTITKNVTVFGRSYHPSVFMMGNQTTIPTDYRYETKTAQTTSYPSTPLKEISQIQTRTPEKKKTYTPENVLTACAASAIAVGFIALRKR